MKKGKIHNNKKFKYIHIISSIVVVVVLSLTICFSAFQNTGLIGDIGASVKPQPDIRVTGVIASTPVNGAVSNYDEYNVTSISSSITLPNSDSALTYEVSVTNFGNIEMLLSALSGLPANLKYTLDPTNYNLNEMICDNITPTTCTLGAVKTINITIGYEDGGYDSSNTTYPFQLDFTFARFNKVAQLGTKYYQSLGEALADVPKNDIQTTVTLLQNTSENVTIYAHQNVNLNLQTFTLSNDDNNNVIKNYGTLYITNGTINSDAATNGAVNNYEKAYMYISGGTINSTGGRQALYNERGNVTISGTALLTATTGARAAVSQTSSGTMIITGGTIISTGSYALKSEGALVVGIQGDSMSTTDPVFQGVDNGIYSTTNFSFYDGVVRSSTTTPFNDVSKARNVESGYGLVSSTETISGVRYNVSYLGIAKKVTFNANGGSVNESIRYVEVGHQIGSLPIPTRAGYTFDGWFTAQTGGTQISASYVVNADLPVWAHWTQGADVARIGQTLYPTLVDAVTAAGNNTTTIEILQSSSEDVTIESTQDITIDLRGYTLSNVGNRPIFTTAGTLTLTNGYLSTSATQGAINVTGGNVIVDDFNITANTRQAIYITGGTVTVRGNSQMSSNTSGKPSGSQMERGTIQVVSGTLIIESGTITAANQQAVSNQGTVIIGTQDGNINSSSPVLQGKVYGVKSTGTFYFYDGILKGRTATHSGTIANNPSLSTGTESVGGQNYYTAYPLTE